MDWSKVSGAELFMACMQISFKCKRCGKCCKLVDGIAYNSVDCLRMAKHLGIDLNDFRERYTIPSTKKATDRWLDQSAGQCPFLGEKGCLQYEGRGQVCRAYPWYTAGAVMQARQGKGFRFFPECPGAVEHFKEVLKMAQNPLYIKPEKLLNMDFAKHAWLYMLAGEGKEQQATKICREMGYFNLVPLYDLEVTCKWWAVAWLTLMGPHKLQLTLDEVAKYE